MNEIIKTMNVGDKDERKKNDCNWNDVGNSFSSI